MLGITLTNKYNQSIHTFRDWGLVPKTRFNVDPAEPKYLFEELTGSNAIIDLTESLTGYVCYKMRSCEITFTIVGQREAWSSIYSNVLNFVQGEEMTIISDEDPRWYWKGRCEVSDWNTLQKTGKITISGQLEPYKISLEAINGLWLWDTFNFESGVIRSNVYQLSGDEEYPQIKVYGSKKHVVPIFEFTMSPTSGGAVALIWNGEERFIAPNDIVRFPDVVIGDGENTLKFHVTPYVTPASSYTVTIFIDYDVGSL